MNLQTPVSTIMTKDLLTVDPKDPVEKVKNLFEDHNIHHVLVVHRKQLKGLISKTDFAHFLHGFVQNKMDEILRETRLKAWKAGEIMTKDLVLVDQNATIREALEIFRENRFHAIPVMDGERLAGIITTYDILETLIKEG